MRRIAKLSTTAGILCALVGTVAPAASAATDNDTPQSSAPVADEPAVTAIDGTVDSPEEVQNTQKDNRPYCALEVNYYNESVRFPPNCKWPDVPKRNLDELVHDTLDDVGLGFLKR